jgi:pimeloyl-ACP methyl ester carboxylesterase
VKGYRIVDWPADVAEFANALGLERSAVAGISSGSPYALACARFIPERLKGCAVVSGLPPLTVRGEKLDPSHYLMPEELLMARLAKTVPFAESDIPVHPVADQQASGERDETGGKVPRLVTLSCSSSTR